LSINAKIYEILYSYNITCWQNKLIPPKSIENQNAEIVALAKSIIEPDDSHKYLDDIIDGLGDEESIGLYKVIEELSKHPEWKSYTKSVRNWLINEKNNLSL